MTIPLDRIDQHILAILARQGRISYRALAEQVHLTPRPCQARVRKLERAGIIRGYHAELALPQHDSVVVLVQVALSDQSGRAAQQAFEHAMLACEQVEDCWLVSGEFNYQLRLRCRDLAQFHQLSAAWLENPQLRIGRLLCSPQLQQIKLGR